MTMAMQPTTLREEAHTRIVELLNTGVLEPGAVVTQRGLVERIGSTLGAVREAIPRLEAEGLLIPLRQRGLMVPTIDVPFVRNAYQLRTILEMEALSHVPRLIAPDQLAAWEDQHLQYLDRLVRGATPDLAAQVQAMDWAWHQSLIDSLGNELISGIYRVNATKMRMAAQARLQVTTGNVVRILTEHLAFLGALRKGDAVTAAAALERHLANSETLALGGAID